MSIKPIVYVTRQQSRSVDCPFCGAKPQGRCIGKRGLREASHKDRVEEWIMCNID